MGVPEAEVHAFMRKVLDDPSDPAVWFALSDRLRDAEEINFSAYCWGQGVYGTAVSRARLASQMLPRTAAKE